MVSDVESLTSVDCLDRHALQGQFCLIVLNLGIALQCNLNFNLSNITLKWILCTKHTYMPSLLLNNDKLNCQQNVEPFLGTGCNHIMCELLLDW